MGLVQSKLEERLGQFEPYFLGELCKSLVYIFKALSIILIRVLVSCEMLIKVFTIQEKLTYTGHNEKDYIQKAQAGFFWSQQSLTLIF